MNNRQKIKQLKQERDLWKDGFYKADENFREACEYWRVDVEELAAVKQKYLIVMNDLARYIERYGLLEEES